MAELVAPMPYPGIYALLEGAEAARLRGHAIAVPRPDRRRSGRRHARCDAGPALAHGDGPDPGPRRRDGPCPERRDRVRPSRRADHGRGARSVRGSDAPRTSRSPGPRRCTRRSAPTRSGCTRTSSSARARTASSRPMVPRRTTAWPRSSVDTTRRTCSASTRTSGPPRSAKYPSTWDGAADHQVGGAASCPRPTSGRRHGPLDRRRARSWSRERPRSGA